MDSKEEKMWDIPMILGVPTTTDSYELYKYMADICKGGPDSTKLLKEFSAKFPGLKQAIVAVLKEVMPAVGPYDGEEEITKRTNETRLEFTDRRVRATLRGKTSIWHHPDPNTPLEPSFVTWVCITCNAPIPPSEDKECEACIERGES